MTKRPVNLLYEGPKDPENPDDRRSSQDTSYQTEFIEITVAHLPLYDTPRTVIRHFNINSEKSLRTILIELEEKIKERAGLEPNRRDLLVGTACDSAFTHQDSRRHITYFSADPETHKGKMTGEECSELLRMHRLVYPIFNSYIQQMEIDSKNGNGHHNGNGHSNGKNGHSNGNGNGKNGKH